MNEVLFKESPKESEKYMRYSKVGTVILSAAVIFFSVFTLLFHLFKTHIGAILMWGIVLFVGGELVKLLLQKRQYLFIYQDRICYRTTYQRAGREIAISPSQYKIVLHPALPKSGYTIRFDFVGADGQKLFTYRAVALVASPFQAEPYQWEIDLFHIGCDIVDEGEVIKNA